LTRGDVTDKGSINQRAVLEMGRPGEAIYAPALRAEVIA